MPDGQVSPELEITPPVVEIRYRGIDQEKSLFTIDGKDLGAALSHCGFPDKSLKPIIIQDGKDALALAEFNHTDQAVCINQGNLVKQIRDLYRDLLIKANISDLPPTQKGIFDKIQESSLFKGLFMPNWPYYLMKDGPSRNFYPGDQDKVNRYMKRAKEGTLYPGLSSEDRDQRTKESMQRLTSMYAARMTSWIIAHEFEHNNRYGVKNAIKIAATIGPIAAGSAIMALFGHNMPEGAQWVNAALTVGGLFAGGIAAKTYDEQASYTAGDKFFLEIMKSFKVNPIVFNEQVLGIDLNSSTGNSNNL